MNKPRKLSSTQYLLCGLVPYTEPNLKLTFMPSKFFAELEQRDKIKQNTARNAFYRALKSGLIEQDSYGNVCLTEKGKKRISTFKAKKLKNAQLMIIFDIPEIERWKRQHLRNLLKELEFKQIQKSVWVTSFDHKKLLTQEIAHLDMKDCIKLFECSPIK